LRQATDYVEGPGKKELIAAKYHEIARKGDINLRSLPESICLELLAKSV
jgi:hypothetical protein